MYSLSESEARIVLSALGERVFAIFGPEGIPKDMADLGETALADSIRANYPKIDMEMQYNETHDYLWQEVAEEDIRIQGYREKLEKAMTSWPQYDEESYDQHCVMVDQMIYTLDGLKRKVFNEVASGWGLEKMQKTVS
jgi:hypothetical protein